MYTAIMAQLKKEVPALKWIDIDYGQIDKQSERPAVAFPCAVVGISLSNCEDISDVAQVCRASVTVRIAQNPPTSRTNSEASEQVRENSLQKYDLIDKVLDNLQGFDNGEFNPLSRRGQSIERRTDGLFVCRIDFVTEFETNWAEEEG